MALKRKTFLKKNSKSFNSLHMRRTLRVKRLKRDKASIASRHQLHFMLQQAPEHAAPALLRPGRVAGASWPVRPPPVAG